MSREEIEQYHNQELQKQVQYAYENAPAMRAKLDQVGVKPSDIRTVKDLEKIPITTKDQLIELRKADPPWGGLLAIPQEKLRKIYMSPGPIYDVQSLDSNFFPRWRRRLHAHGFRAGDIVVNTFSYHMVPAGHWFDEAVRQIGATVIPMGVGNTELQVQVLHDMRVTGWIGTIGFLVTILNKAEELGYDPCKDFFLRTAAAGGEMGGGPIRKTIQEKYGLITYDSYGTADVGLIAYECLKRSGMHIHPEVVVEIVDPNTGKQLSPGEVGQVVVTPFDTTYPLIRFGTGDLSSYTNELCPCGRSALKLTRIMGRVGDAIRTRGMFIHPRQVSEAISRFPQVSKYQAVVTRIGFRDKLILKIELAGQGVDRESLKVELGKAFQNICRLRVDEFEFIPTGTIPESAKVIVDERTYE
jgi:phenylacetate-CoA ligase